MISVKMLQGKDSKDDRLILINEKALRLSEIFQIVELFAENELNRIRVSKVRQEIIEGKRPFMFEKAITDIFKRVKRRKKQ